MGELHLEIIVDRLLREFKVEANVGAPQVAYKEAFTNARAENGSSSEECLTISLPSISVPWIGGMSVGAGIYSS